MDTSIDNTITSTDGSNDQEQYPIANKSKAYKRSIYNKMYYEKHIERRRIEIKKNYTENKKKYQLYHLNYYRNKRSEQIKGNKKIRELASNNESQQVLVVDCTHRK